MAHPITYLLIHHLKGRLRSAGAKLRRPRVILAALLVLGYLGLMGLAVTRGNDTLRGREFEEASGYVGGIGIMLIAMGAWVSLRKARLHPLGFRQADVELLFPLPISRRLLVVYRLVAAQGWLVVLSFIIPLFLRTGNIDSPSALIARWIFFNICFLHLVVAAFAHGTRRDAGLGRLLFAWLPGILIFLTVLGGLALAGIDLGRLLSHEFLEEAERICTSTTFAHALAPFRVLSGLVVAPPGTPAFAQALGWGSFTLAAHVAWVFLQDSRFEEASLRAAELRAARLEAWKRGEWSPWRSRLHRGPVKARPFRLAPTGAAVWAYAWSAILASGRRYTLRNGVIAVALSACFGFALRLGADHIELELPQMVGLALVVGANFAAWMYLVIVLGRRRQELGLMETLAILRPLPVPGRTVFLGRLLGDVATTMALYLLLWTTVGAFLWSAIEQEGPYALLLLGLSLAAMTLLVALGHALEMAMALWLPFTATFHVGPGGFGHNLMVLLCRVLGLAALLVLPGIVVALGAFLLAGSRAAPFACLLLGGAIVLAEVAAVAAVGGWLYDRFDVAAEM